MIGGETAGKGTRGLADLMRGGSVEAVAVAARDVASSSPSKPTSALEMMRYQRIGPDCLPLANGGGSGGNRKPPAPSPRSSMDEDVPAVASDSSRLASYLSTAPLEPKPRARAPHPQPPAPAQAPAFSSATGAATRSPAYDYGHQPSDFPDHTLANPNGGGGSPDAAMLLQWGHNKRSRGRRDAAAASAAASAPAISPAQVRRQAVVKIQRRASAPAQKLMPPSSTRGPNLRITSSLPSRPAAAAAADALHGRGPALPHQRSVEERAGGQQPPAPKQRPAAADKAPRKAAEARATPEPKHQKGYLQLQAELLHDALGSPSKQQQQQKPELPRIFTTLSRKEKEEDFMAMKGTKLPQRPKKRPKHAEKAVSYICPGTWLAEVTRNKYEVREKKSKKQKRRSGLKGMESSDSD